MKKTFNSLLCSRADRFGVNQDHDEASKNVCVDVDVVGDTEGNDFLEMYKKCASIFRRLMVEHVKALSQLGRYPENDNSIAKKLQRVDSQNTVVITNLITCNAVRNSLCNAIGKTYFATFRAADLGGSARTSKRKNFEVIPSKNYHSSKRVLN